MIQKIEKSVILFLEGVLFSYAQVFFSKHKAFGLLLIVVTFFDWISGLSGMVAVVTANLAAVVMGFHRNSVSQGFYGFNSLLVGLGMGLFYQPGFEFFTVLVFASLFTFFLTIWLQGFFWKYGLPYLSWPFLFGIWLVSLASGEFSALAVSDRGIFLLNEIYRYGGMQMVNLYYWVNDLQIHISITTYFRSLAAIFFQYNLLAGVLVAIGLIIYSRIAFLLSLTGFFAAWFFYAVIGADLTDLSYTYIGFNFILSAIAIGGFLIVPSRWSFLWVLLLTPVLAFVISSTGIFFDLVGLPIYSLAFNIVVLLFLYVLKLRERNFYRPELVVVQRFSPEENLYTQANYKSRFDINAIVNINLPFMDEWTVTQAHDGEHTHRDQYRHAWDFEVMDEEGKKYSGYGAQAGDFYAFNKPVLAPADGLIQEIRDGIPDNPVGEMNLGANWGNTVIIKHAENVYSKLSHLKQGSIKTFKGAYVKQGEVIAYCGNSGRSPVPHLHFQLQADPFIGSKTIDFPIANYLLKTKSGYELKTYARPKKDQIVTNIVKNDGLFRAFNFIPGQTISFEVQNNNAEVKRINWDVKSDMYNNTYLECRETESMAYFHNDGHLFYFTHFEGDKNCFLYHFYLGAYRVVLGFYNKLEVADTYPLSAFRSGAAKFFQDFIAPFKLFMHAGFLLKYLKMEDNFTSSTIMMTSQAQLTAFHRVVDEINYSMVVTNGRITRFIAKSTKYDNKAEEVAS
jgi:urea transporter/murein DD-endopeptidase MepM/ murein hydrolase activator NlpD